MQTYYFSYDLDHDLSYAISPHNIGRRYRFFRMFSRVQYISNRLKKVRAAVWFAPKKEFV